MVADTCAAFASCYSNTIGVGQAGRGYPWQWSIYRWIEGQTIAATPDLDHHALADDLAMFLLALQHIDCTDGPAANADNFYRGGALAVYDAETRKAIAAIQDKPYAHALLHIWNAGCQTRWTLPPVWLHGDISATNLLINGGRLHAVIDFGQLAIGDPACDLAIAWTLFDADSRVVFKQAMQVDEETWNRGRAWALWKALITVINPDHAQSVLQQAWHVIDQIVAGYVE